jgi:hypothetical protein
MDLVEGSLIILGFRGTQGTACTLIVFDSFIPKREKQF